MTDVPYNINDAKTLSRQTRQNFTKIIRNLISLIHVIDFPYEIKMHHFITDDSRQNTPSRPGMGQLVGIGGFYSPADQIASLERSIENLCRSTGFPPNEEFKWSPGRDLWMHDNLKDDKRESFFKSVISLIGKHLGRIIVVISDTSASVATGAHSSEQDVTNLFLERVQWVCERARTHGVVITDRPSGNRADEDKFLLSCLETLQQGTNYIKPVRVALNVLSAPSKFIRLIQASDLIVGCTLSVVAGARNFSPPIFSLICPLLDCAFPGPRAGGVGLKIHPFFKYANLYYWLLNETVYWKSGTGTRLPIPDLPYPQNPYAIR